MLLNYDYRFIRKSFFYIMYIHHVQQWSKIHIISYIKIRYKYAHMYNYWNIYVNTFTLQVFIFYNIEISIYYNFLF